MLKTRNAFIIPKMIVYVRTKDMAWKVYSHLLRESVQRCYLGVFHADLTQATKSSVYQNFRSNGSSLKCLIATVAFGMVRVLGSYRNQNLGCDYHPQGHCGFNIKGAPKSNALYIV